MLESYEAYADYRDVMDMLEQLVATRRARGDRRRRRCPWKGGEIDFAPPWRRVDLRDALREASGIDVREHADEASLRGGDARRGARRARRRALGASSSTSC